MLEDDWDEDLEIAAMTQGIGNEIQQEETEETIKERIQRAKEKLLEIRQRTDEKTHRRIALHTELSQQRLESGTRDRYYEHGKGWVEFIVPKNTDEGIIVPKNTNNRGRPKREFSSERIRIRTTLLPYVRFLESTTKDLSDSELATLLNSLRESLHKATQPASAE